MSVFAEYAIRAITRVSTALAMLGLALLVILFSANIVGRASGLPIPAVDDLGTFALAAVFSFGLAAAVGHNEHLSIDILTQRLPGRVRFHHARAVEIVSVVVASYLLTGTYRLTAAAYRSNEKLLGALPIPRYLPMSIVLAGVALFTLALLLVFLRNLARRAPDARG